MEEQTWRVPLLVSWSAEESLSDGSYGVAEKAQAVLEEFQERQAVCSNMQIYGNSM